MQSRRGEPFRLSLPHQASPWVLILFHELPDVDLAYGYRNLRYGDLPWERTPSNMNSAALAARPRNTVGEWLGV